MKIKDFLLMVVVLGVGIVAGVWGYSKCSLYVNRFNNMDGRLSKLERRYDAYKAQAELDNYIRNYEPPKTNTESPRKESSEETRLELDSKE